MTALPTNRTTSSTISEHVNDHNEVHRLHNELDGHAGAADPHAGYRLESAPITAADVAADVATQAELDAHAHTTVAASTQSASAYTAVLADAGKVVRTTFAGAATLTIPANATTAFAVGTIINAYAAGGALTIAAAGGVTIRNNAAALAQYGEASLRKDGTDEWVRVG